jgi:hypothetical protein
MILASCGATPQSVNPYVQITCTQEVDLTSLPSEFNLDVPYTKQKPNYCLPTSVSMILEFYGIYASQEELADEDAYKFGMSFNDFTPKMVQYSMWSNIESCVFSGLLSLIASGNPLIVRIQNSTATQGHAIVITGYDLVLERVYVNDPANPYKEYMDFEDFQTRWDTKDLGKQNSKNLTYLIIPNIVF